jgi:hypothetical protein
MEQRWYNPVTRTWEQVVPPADDATARDLFFEREKAVKVYKYLRGPAYRLSVQMAFKSTWEHFQLEDNGLQSPISTEVADL